MKTQRLFIAFVVVALSFFNYSFGSPVYNVEINDIAKSPSYYNDKSISIYWCPTIDGHKNMSLVSSGGSVYLGFPKKVRKSKDFSKYLSRYFIDPFESNKMNRKLAFSGRFEWHPEKDSSFPLLSLVVADIGECKK